MKPSWAVIAILLGSLSTPGRESGSPRLDGSTPLGQKPPGARPEVFASGIISTKADEYALEVSASGDESLFVREASIMLAARNEDGTWTSPVVAPFSGQHVDGEPCFSPDGRKIYFMSRRPLAGSKLPSNLWVSEKSGGVWQAARPVAGLVLEKQLHAPSFAASGSIYEDGLVLFEWSNGRYLPARKLPEVDGGFPFIAPDESYVIYAKRLPGRRDRDLFISFRKPDGAWSPGLSLGDEINSSDNEGNSFVTADGRYLFFSKKYDIYWVSAEIITSLKKNLKRTLDERSIMSNQAQSPSRRTFQLPDGDVLTSCPTPICKEPKK